MKEQPIRYEVTFSLSDYEMETIQNALDERCETLDQIAIVNRKNGHEKMAAWQKANENELRKLNKKIGDTFYRARFAYYSSRNKNP